MSLPGVSDAAYMQSYYPSMSFQYLNQGGLNEGAWSNGDPMSFLGGYGQMDNNMYGGTGMFGGIYQQPPFDWGFPGGDYNAWGNTAAQQQQQSREKQQQDSRGYATDGYGYGMPHGPDAYGVMNGEMDKEVKAVEQNFKGMSFQDHKSDPGHKDHHVTIAQGPAPVPAKKTWASIASQPARPQTKQPKSIPRAPLPANKHMDIGTWDANKGSAVRQGGTVGGAVGGSQSRQGAQQQQQAWGGAGRGGGGGATGERTGGVIPYSAATARALTSTAVSNMAGGGGGATNGAVPLISHPVLDKLRSANQYNPKEFNLTPKGARYFVIKSYSEDDIHRSIKYSIWCSTEHGNKRLDYWYRQTEGKGPMYLFFSVNGSGHFCGMAQMMSPVDYNSSASVWAQDKWKGQLEVKWIYVKDVPNSQLRHIRLENNENKPVTNSRDTQEVRTRTHTYIHTHARTHGGEGESKHARAQAECSATNNTKTFARTQHGRGASYQPVARIKEQIQR